MILQSVSTNVYRPKQENIVQNDQSHNEITN